MHLNDLLNMLFGMFFIFAGEGDAGLLGTPAGGGGGDADADLDDGDVDDGLVAEGWLQGSQTQFAEDPIMANIKDVPTLVQNYINAQRMVGKKGHILPDANSGEDAWNEHYTKMGRPVDAAGYELKADSLDEDFVKEFARVAHKNGLRSEQARELMDYYNKSANQETELELKARSEASNAEVNSLKEEWGEGFDTKLYKAQTVAQQFGGEGFIAEMEEMGLQNNPTLLKFLANVGESLREDTFETQAVQNFAMTPDQASAEIQGIMDSSESPYWKPNHQDHFKVKAHVEKLYKIIS